MIMTNKKMVNDIKRLSEISRKELPIKVSYIIAKNISNIANGLKAYEIERERLISKYAARDQEGHIRADENGQIIFKDEKSIERWNKDANELLTMENEIEIYKFNIVQLEDCSCNITPADIMLIDYMIEE